MFDIKNSNLNNDYLNNHSMKKSVPSGTIKGSSRANTKIQTTTYTRLKAKEDTKKVLPDKTHEKENRLNKERPTTAMEATRKGLKIEETKHKPANNQTTKIGLKTSGIRTPIGSTQLKGIATDRSKQGKLNYDTHGKKDHPRGVERPKTTIKPANKTMVKNVVAKPKLSATKNDARVIKERTINKTIITKDGTKSKPRIKDTINNKQEDNSSNKEIQQDEIVTEEELKIYEHLLKAGFTLQQVLLSKEHCEFGIESTNTCLQSHGIILKVN